MNFPILFVFSANFEDGDLLHVKLNYASYNCTVVVKEIDFFFLLCASLNLNFPGERKNAETDRFHGGGPYCKTPTKNQPIRVLYLA